MNYNSDFLCKCKFFFMLIQLYSTNIACVNHLLSTSFLPSSHSLARSRVPLLAVVRIYFLWICLGKRETCTTDQALSGSENLCHQNLAAQRSLSPLTLVHLHPKDRVSPVSNTVHDCYSHFKHGASIHEQRKVQYCTINLFCNLKLFQSIHVIRLNYRKKSWPVFSLESFKLGRASDSWVVVFPDRGYFVCSLSFPDVFLSPEKC